MSSRRLIDQMSVDAALAYAHTAKFGVGIDNKAVLALQSLARAQRSARQEIGRLNEQNAKLRQFVGIAINDVRGDNVGCDWDGGDVQQAMVDCDVLKEFTARAACGEGCACAAVDGFPQQCFKLTQLGLACLAHAVAVREMDRHMSSPRSAIDGAIVTKTYKPEKLAKG